MIRKRWMEVLSQVFGGVGTLQKNVDKNRKNWFGTWLGADFFSDFGSIWFQPTFESMMISLYVADSGTCDVSSLEGSSKILGIFCLQQKLSKKKAGVYQVGMQFGTSSLGQTWRCRPFRWFFFSKKIQGKKTRRNQTQEPETSRRCETGSCWFFWWSFRVQTPWKKTPSFTSIWKMIFYLCRSIAKANPRKNKHSKGTFRFCWYDGVPCLEKLDFHGHFGLLEGTSIYNVWYSPDGWKTILSYWHGPILRCQIQLCWGILVIPVVSIRWSNSILWERSEMLGNHQCHPDKNGLVCGLQVAVVQNSKPERTTECENPQYLT